MRQTCNPSMANGGTLSDRALRRALLPKRIPGLATPQSEAIMADMQETQRGLDSDSMLREKRTVAGNSVLAALIITTLKIVVGVATQSLGILSEAAHSGLDLIA